MGSDPQRLSPPEALAAHREERKASPVDWGVIHIRKRPDAPSAEPAWCGEKYGSTITDAWGYWGPDGDGFASVCRACIAAKAKP